MACRLNKRVNGRVVSNQQVINIAPPSINPSGKRNRLMNRNSTLQHIGKAGLNESHIAVLRELHRNGTATRVDLAAATGKSTQSLTRLSRELIESGLIVEGERRQKQRGQPAIFLSVKPGVLVSFGLVFEHGAITCIAKELGGEQLVYLKKLGDFSNAATAIARANELLSSALQQCAEHRYTLGVGVSVSGFFRFVPHRQLVCRHDIEGWQQVDLTSFIHSAGDIPVFVENDGRAAAIGQAVDGIAKKYDSFFQILMTKGVGGGFVRQGRLQSGHNANAGEFASLLNYTTDDGKRYFRPTTECLIVFLQEHWGYTPSWQEVEQGLVDNDDFVMQWLDNVAANITPGLNAVAALLDPQSVVLAGRLPTGIRRALAKKLSPEGVNFAGLKAPFPEIVAAPEQDCLAMGAVTLPVANTLY